MPSRRAYILISVQDIVSGKAFLHHSNTCQHNQQRLLIIQTPSQSFRGEVTEQCLLPNIGQLDGTATITFPMLHG